MIEIETNVPIPGSRAGRPRRWPIYTMDVDESFLFPIEMHSSVRGAIRRSKPKKFVIRKIDDGHYRCWRVA